MPRTKNSKVWLIDCNYCKRAFEAIEYRKKYCSAKCYRQKVKDESWLQTAKLRKIKNKGKKQTISYDGDPGFDVWDNEVDSRMNTPHINDVHIHIERKF